MAFKDIAAMNQHLADRSHSEGFVSGKAAMSVFESLEGVCPNKAQYPHAAGWYRHIKRFEAAGCYQFPQGRNDTQEVTAAAAAAAAKPANPAKPAKPTMTTTSTSSDLTKKMRTPSESSKTDLLLMPPRSPSCLL